ncbi:tetratricopeptide repeat protein [Streptomyces mexicanus]
MNICKFLGESGRRQEALDAYLALLPDVRRLRGEDHPNTLTVRLNIARYTWELGDPARALELHEELIEDQRRVRGADHPSVLITRYNIAMLKADLGDLATALAELDAPCGSASPATAIPCTRRSSGPGSAGRGSPHGQGTRHRPQPSCAGSGTTGPVSWARSTPTPSPHRRSWTG